MTQTRALGGDTPFAARPPADQLPAYSSRPPSTMTTGGNSHHRGESHPENRLSRPPPALTAGYHRRDRSHPPNSTYQPNHWGGESCANCPLVQPRGEVSSGESQWPANLVIHCSLSTYIRENVNINIALDHVTLLMHDHTLSLVFYCTLFSSRHWTLVVCPPSYQTYRWLGWIYRRGKSIWRWKQRGTAN